MSGIWRSILLFIAMISAIILMSLVFFPGH